MVFHIAKFIQTALLFPPEIGRNFSPSFRFPLENRGADGMNAKPLLGTADDFVEFFGFGRMFEFGLAMFFMDPRHCRETVGIDDFVGDSALFHQCEGVDNRQKLADVVRAENGSEMEHLFARRKVDALIFHLSGITRTSGIDGPGGGPTPTLPKGGGRLSNSIHCFLYFTHNSFGIVQNFFVCKSNNAKP